MKSDPSIFNSNGFQVEERDGGYFLTKYFSKMGECDISDFAELLKLLLKNGSESLKRIRTKKFKAYLAKAVNAHCSALNFTELSIADLESMIHKAEGLLCPHKEPIFNEVAEVLALTEIADST